MNQRLAGCVAPGGLLFGGTVAGGTDFHRNVPLYFFHIRGGHLPTEAVEGWVHPDDGAALEAARAAARALIANDILDGILDLAARIEVEDEAGKLVLTVPFASVVQQP